MVVHVILSESDCGVKWPQPSSDPHAQKKNNKTMDATEVSFSSCADKVVIQMTMRRKTRRKRANFFYNHSPLMSEVCVDVEPGAVGSWRELLHRDRFHPETQDVKAQLRLHLSAPPHETLTARKSSRAETDAQN